MVKYTTEIMKLWVIPAFVVGVFLIVYFSAYIYQYKTVYYF